MEPDRCISCIRYGRKLYTEKSSKLPFLLPAYFRAIALPRFGNHVASCGYTAIKSMVANRATQYATVPRNISPFFKSGSSVTAAFTVNTRMPNGVVSSPVSIARIPIIANAIGSNPKADASGPKTGTVSKIIEIESISAPNTNHQKQQTQQKTKDGRTSERKKPYTTPARHN